MSEKDFWEGYVPEPVKPAEKEPIGYWNGFFDAGDVATISKFKRVHNSQNAPLYTSPPAQRTWVGLADDEIYSVLENLQVMYNRPPTTDSRIIFARAIEAKLKEKNNG